MSQHREAKPVLTVSPSFEEIRCLDVSLADKLEAYGSHLKNEDPDFADAYAALIERLVAADAGSGAPGVGAILPPFFLSDAKGRLTSLAELLDAGPLVVSFNRGHWCSYCRLELLAMAEIYPEIRDLGADLISVMPERAAPIRRIVDGFDLPFRILTDLDNGYALSCGLMISLGDHIRRLFNEDGIDVSDYQGNDGFFVPIPATFILAPDGSILNSYVNPDFTCRMPPADILATLRDVA